MAKAPLTRQGPVAALLRAVAAALPAWSHGDGAGSSIRVGHFPNDTHVQALVARDLERQGQDWFGPRLPEGVRIQWFAYNAGPSAMEAIFAGSLDLAYVGPNPTINAFARSGGDEIRVVVGTMAGGPALVVQGDSDLSGPEDGTAAGAWRRSRSHEGAPRRPFRR